MKYLQLTRPRTSRALVLVDGPAADPIPSHRPAAFQFFAGKRDATKLQQRQQVWCREKKLAAPRKEERPLMFDGTLIQENKRTAKRENHNQ